MRKKYTYQELIEYTRMHKLPKGFTESYEQYEPEDKKQLMSRELFYSLLAPYDLDYCQLTYLTEALDAIEADERLLYFSNFFVWDMCSVRNKYDVDNYSELVPDCIGRYNEAYCFLVLLACVEVSELEMKRRGIPYEYYQDIPHRMLREQLSRYKEQGKIDVLDMPWKLNFYTLVIFLFDRFLFIPYVHGDRFTMYRNYKTGKVVGICDDNCSFTSEGQLIEDEADEASAKSFTTSCFEDDNEITGFYMNPLGFTERKQITLSKAEYKPALMKDDWLLAFHIPSGEGYTPSRVQNSMRLALAFYSKYYPELPIKGFWSESWLYDSRLSLLLTEDKNIIRVQRQFFNYSGGWDGEMLYIHLFKDTKTRLEDFTCRTSLQQKAKDYLLKGYNFYSTGMIFLSEELDSMTEEPGVGQLPYITPNDFNEFKLMLQENNIEFRQ